MTHSVCFFTVCGGGEDYEFLLGSIEHHSKMGQHVVLDTTPPEWAKTFRRLPKTVRWIHEPVYGSGWKEFRLRTATERAMRLGKEMGTDVLVYLDCDEFFSSDCAKWAFLLAKDRMVEVKTVTWKPDGKPYDLGESEWHRRIWPSSMGVQILQNEAWIGHPLYNGNPEHHPIPSPPDHKLMVRAHGSLHHHLHYAIGEKASQTDTADTTIQEWKNGGVELSEHPIPSDLSLWWKGKKLPSDKYS